MLSFAVILGTMGVRKGFSYLYSIFFILHPLLGVSTHRPSSWNIVPKGLQYSTAASMLRISVPVPPSLRSSSFSFSSPFPFLCSFFERKVSRSIDHRIALDQAKQSQIFVVPCNGYSNSNCMMLHISSTTCCVCHRFSWFWRAQQWVSISKSSLLNHTQAFLRESNARSKYQSMSEGMLSAPYLQIRRGNLIIHRSNTLTMR